MNDPEGFLSRWSRRKREADNVPSNEDAQGQESGSAQPETQPPKSQQAEAQNDKDPQKNETAEPAEAAFDISKLPPIESITAETDIRAFLAPGVPAALTQAALRRAWVADPKIRDFIEMAENQWDFTAPGVPGFDLSPPTGDIRRMLAQILGDKPADESPTAAQQIADTEREPGAARSPDIESAPSQAADEPVRSDDERASDRETTLESQHQAAPQSVVAEHQDIGNATQQNDATQNDAAPAPKHTHGSALPR